MGRNHLPTAPSTASVRHRHLEPIEPPWQAIQEWIPDDDPDLNWFNQERDPTGTEPESYDQSSTWQPIEVSLDDGRILVLDDS